METTQEQNENNIIDTTNLTNLTNESHNLNSFYKNAYKGNK